MGGKSQTWERVAGLFGRAREGFRRAMPRAALAALALFLLRLFIRDTSLYQNTPVGLLGPVTLVVCLLVALYFGLKLAVRLKRKLLWRVRRRLIITYLFVGLTPVVLLLVLGALAATSGSSQAMVRVVTVEIEATERQALESAKALAGSLAKLPPNTPAREAREWLEERAALLRAALPGARVHAWRGEEGAHTLFLGQGRPAELSSVDASEDARGVGPDAADAPEALPAWLGGRAEWNGFAFLPPAGGANTAFGTPSVRALARTGEGSRAAAVLVSVPVSRALVTRYRENTGVNVRPFFVGARLEEERRGGVRVRQGGGGEGPAEVARDWDNFDISRDQFGEPLPPVDGFNFPSPVFLDATDWQTGERQPRWSFVLDWSWSEGGKQFWNNLIVGQTLWQMLYVITIIFLLLELLALFSAGWMTRAVTGTVHKLYRATESVKRGDFSHRIRTRSHDQLGELALAFNDMSANIEALLAERVGHERLKREVEIAHEVQAQLFPRSTPALRSAHITGECRAALGVAGDYYDFVEVTPGLIAIALGDVSGKGLSASLVMSNLQATLRAQVSIIAERLRVTASAAVAGDGGAQAFEMPCGVTETDNGCLVSRMAERINEQLCRSTDADRFATLFLALYDDATRTLRYTNAGHNAPLLVRAGGTVERLWTGGTVLGAFDGVPFEEGQAALGEGDLLAVYSDGITEAQRADGEEFGEGRLLELLIAHRTETAENIRTRILESAESWAGQADRGDDQTVVILKAVNREP
ncbi:MAG TPA: SpoIIE family protein phosphatase [Pyrinomonadaceae bacterium]|nr:SpoIIE family protein phosphatase [Pyrinomonadaceae bacterium]